MRRLLRGDRARILAGGSGACPPEFLRCGERRDFLPELPQLLDPVLPGADLQPLLSPASDLLLRATETAIDDLETLVELHGGEPPQSLQINLETLYTSTMQEGEQAASRREKLGFF
jgi:hypothetical protein